MAKAPWYPKATRQELMNDRGGSFVSLGLLLHVQAGNNNPYGWFDRPEVKGSSHWWISKSGEVVQYVPADLQAWAQAEGNRDYHSVETEGWPEEDLTERQFTALGDLYRWGYEEWGWPLQLAEKPKDSGFGWHGMGGRSYGGHTGCPGDKRKAKRQAILELAQGDDDMPTPETRVAACKAPEGGIWTLTYDGGVRATQGAPFWGSYPGLKPEGKLGGPRWFIAIEAAGSTNDDGYTIISNNDEADDYTFNRKFWESQKQ